MDFFLITRKYTFIHYYNCKSNRAPCYAARHSFNLFFVINSFLLPLFFNKNCTFITNKYFRITIYLSSYLNKQSYIIKVRKIITFFRKKKSHSMNIYRYCLCLIINLTVIRNVGIFTCSDYRRKLVQ